MGQAHICRRRCQPLLLYGRLRRRPVRLVATGLTTACGRRLYTKLRVQFPPSNDLPASMVVITPPACGGAIADTARKATAPTVLQPPTQCSVGNLPLYQSNLLVRNMACQPAIQAVRAGHYADRAASGFSTPGFSCGTTPAKTVDGVGARIRCTGNGGVFHFDTTTPIPKPPPPPPPSQCPQNARVPSGIYDLNVYGLSCSAAVAALNGGKFSYDNGTNPTFTTAGFSCSLTGGYKPDGVHYAGETFSCTGTEGRFTFGTGS